MLFCRRQAYFQFSDFAHDGYKKTFSRQKNSGEVHDVKKDGKHDGTGK